MMKKIGGKVNKHMLILCVFVLFSHVMVAQDSADREHLADTLFDLNCKNQPCNFNAFHINNLPFSSLNDFSLLTPAAYYLKGKRMFYFGIEANGASVFIDGMQIQDADDFPLQSIGNYMFYGDKPPIQYGNALIGYTEIQTKNLKDKLALNIDAYADFAEVMRAYTVEFSLGGPIVSRKNKISEKPRPVFFIGGKYSKTNNTDPVWKTNQKLKADVLAGLQENPLRVSGTGTGTYLNAEFVTAEDFTDGGMPDYAGKTSWNSFAKIVVPIGNTFHISVGNYSNINEASQNSFENAIFNVKNNAIVTQRNFDNYMKFSQELIIHDDFNIGYSFQFQYSNYYQRIESETHGKNFFDYGYLGKFNVYKSSTYELGSATVDGVEYDNVWLLNSWNHDTLVTFHAGNTNPEIAAYTNNYYDIYGNYKDGHYENMTQILLGGGLINGSRPKSVYSLWNNNGLLPDNYSENKMERYIGKFQFDLSYKSHDIIIGAEYNKDVQSEYYIKPSGLWNLMRGLANFHIQELDIYNPVISDHDGTIDTIIYMRLFDQDSQSEFDKNLRQKLGLDTGGLDYIITDSYDDIHHTIDYYDKFGNRHTIDVDEDLFSLDLFTPDELLNSGSSNVRYSGYDYKGNKLNGGNENPYSFFDDRTIDALRPVYYAAYVQDKFTWKNLNVTLGIRMDVYDANRPVLIDNYSLTEIHTVASAKQVLPFQQDIPDHIGEDYYVYVDQYYNPSRLLGFRDGDTWYQSDGIEVDDPELLDTGSGLNPLLVYPEIDNLRQDDWQPDMTFTDYKKVLNFLPQIHIDYTIQNRFCFYLDYNSRTQNPTGINIFRPEYYYYNYKYMGLHQTIPNPGLKPLRTAKMQLGFKSILFKYVLLDAAYLINSIDNYYYVALVAGAYPNDYYTVLNNKNRISTNGILLSFNFLNPKVSGFFGGLNFTKLFPNETDKNYYDVSDMVINTNIGYSFGAGTAYKGPVWGNVKVLQDFSASLFYQYRAGTPYLARNNNLTVVTRDTPAFNLVNLKIRKGIYFGENTSLDVYVLIENLFNIKNSFYVYPKTGLSDNDGYLNAPEWQAQINSQLNPESFRLLYQMKLNNPQNFDIPRIIRFGIKLNM
jgi:hypothetical protein